MGGRSRKIRGEGVGDGENRVHQRKREGILPNVREIWRRGEKNRKEYTLMKLRTYDKVSISLLICVW